MEPTTTSGNLRQRVVVTSGGPQFVGCQFMLFGRVLFILLEAAGCDPTLCQRSLDVTYSLAGRCCNLLPCNLLPDSANESSTMH